MSSTSLDNATLSVVFEGMQYFFLPPYSPDLILIELALSSMKHFLRHNGDFYHGTMSKSCPHDKAIQDLEARLKEQEERHASQKKSESTFVKRNFDREMKKRSDFNRLSTSVCIHS